MNTTGFNKPSTHTFSYPALPTGTVIFEGALPDFKDEWRRFDGHPHAALSCALYESQTFVMSSASGGWIVSGPSRTAIKLAVENGLNVLVLDPDRLATTTRTDKLSVLLSQPGRSLQLPSATGRFMSVVHLPTSYYDVFFSSFLYPDFTEQQMNAIYLSFDTQESLSKTTPLFIQISKPHFCWLREHSLDFPKSLINTLATVGIPTHLNHPLGYATGFAAFLLNSLEHVAVAGYTCGQNSVVTYRAETPGVYYKATRVLEHFLSFFNAGCIDQMIVQKVDDTPYVFSAFTALRNVTDIPAGLYLGEGVETSSMFFTRREARELGPEGVSLVSHLQLRDAPATLEGILACPLNSSFRFFSKTSMHYFDPRTYENFVKLSTGLDLSKLSDDNGATFDKYLHQIQLKEQVKDHVNGIVKAQSPSGRATDDSALMATLAMKNNLIKQNQAKAERNPDGMSWFKAFIHRLTSAHTMSLTDESPVSVATGVLTSSKHTTSAPTPSSIMERFGYTYRSANLLDIPSVYRTFTNRSPTFPNPLNSSDCYARVLLQMFPAAQPAVMNLPWSAVLKTLFAFAPLLRIHVVEDIDAYPAGVYTCTHPIEPISTFYAKLLSLYSCILPLEGDLYVSPTHWHYTGNHYARPVSCSTRPKAPVHLNDRTYVFAVFGTTDGSTFSLSPGSLDAFFDDANFDSKVDSFQVYGLSDVCPSGSLNLFALINGWDHVTEETPTSRVPQDKSTPKADMPVRTQTEPPEDDGSGVGPPPLQPTKALETQEAAPPGLGGASGTVPEAPEAEFVTPPVLPGMAEPAQFIMRSPDFFSFPKIEFPSSPRAQNLTTQLLRRVTEAPNFDPASIRIRNPEAKFQGVVDLAKYLRVKSLVYFGANYLPSESALTRTPELFRPCFKSSGLQIYACDPSYLLESANCKCLSALDFLGTLPALTSVLYFDDSQPQNVEDRKELHKKLYYLCQSADSWYLCKRTGIAGVSGDTGIPGVLFSSYTQASPQDTYILGPVIDGGPSAAVDVGALTNYSCDPETLCHTCFLGKLLGTGVTHHNLENTASASLPSALTNSYRLSGGVVLRNPFFVDVACPDSKKTIVLTNKLLSTTLPNLTLTNCKVRTVVVEGYARSCKDFTFFSVCTLFRKAARDAPTPVLHVVAQRKATKLPPLLPNFYFRTTPHRMLEALATGKAPKHAILAFTDVDLMAGDIVRAIICLGRPSLVFASIGLGQIVCPQSADLPSSFLKPHYRLGVSRTLPKSNRLLGLVGVPVAETSQANGCYQVFPAGTTPMQAVSLTLDKRPDKALTIIVLENRWRVTLPLADLAVLTEKHGVEISIFTPFEAQGTEFDCVLILGIDEHLSSREAHTAATRCSGDVFLLPCSTAGYDTLTQAQVPAIKSCPPLTFASIRPSSVYASDVEYEASSDFNPDFKIPVTYGGATYATLAVAYANIQRTDDLLEKWLSGRPRASRIRSCRYLIVHSNEQLARDINKVINTKRRELGLTQLLTHPSTPKSHSKGLDTPAVAPSVRVSKDNHAAPRGKKGNQRKPPKN